MLATENVSYYARFLETLSLWVKYTCRNAKKPHLGVEVQTSSKGRLTRGSDLSAALKNIEELGSRGKVYGLRVKHWKEPRIRGNLTPQSDVPATTHPSVWPEPWPSPAVWSPAEGAGLPPWPGCSGP